MNQNCVLANQTSRQYGTNVTLKEFNKTLSIINYQNQQTSNRNTNQNVQKSFQMYGRNQTQTLNSELSYENDAQTSNNHDNEKNQPLRRPINKKFIQNTALKFRRQYLNQKRDNSTLRAKQVEQQKQIYGSQRLQNQTISPRVTTINFQKGNYYKVDGQKMQNNLHLPSTFEMTPGKESLRVIDQSKSPKQQIIKLKQEERNQINIIKQQQISQKAQNSHEKIDETINNQQDNFQINLIQKQITALTNRGNNQQQLISSRYKRSNKQMNQEKSQSPIPQSARKNRNKTQNKEPTQRKIQVVEEIQNVKQRGNSNQEYKNGGYKTKQNWNQNIINVESSTDNINLRQKGDIKELLKNINQKINSHRPSNEKGELYISNYLKIPDLTTINHFTPKCVVNDQASQQFPPLSSQENTLQVNLGMFQQNENISKRNHNKTIQEQHLAQTNRGSSFLATSIIQQQERNVRSGSTFNTNREGYVHTARKYVVKKNDISYKKFPINGEEALKQYSKNLTQYEKQEIVNFEEVYYINTNPRKQQQSQLNNSELEKKLNYGYDNEEGDYLFEINDHINYRYEILKRLGKGAFGIVLQCFDHKLKEKYALKIIKNKKKLHKQGKIEIRILEQLRDNDIEGKKNIVQIKDSFTFRNHVSRFYRAPEIMLGIPYTTSIDMWSFGCIIYECLVGIPLFVGENENDQMCAIMEVIGKPPRSLIAQATRRKVFFDDDYSPIIIKNSRGKVRIPGNKPLSSNPKLNVDQDLIEFLQGCFEWKPEKRLKPDDALQMPWIQKTINESKLKKIKQIQDNKPAIPNIAKPSVVAATKD